MANSGMVNSGSTKESKKDGESALTDSRKSGNSGRSNNSYMNSFERFRGEGLFGAIFLIMLGVLLLLNTTGLVPWEIWGHLWRFWPILLIVGGLSVIFGKSLWGNIVVVVVGVVALVLAFVVSLVGLNTGGFKNNWGKVPPFMTGMENIQEVESSTSVVKEEYDDVEELRFVGNFGAAKFEIVDKASDNYLSLDSKYYEGLGEPSLKPSQNGEVLEIDFFTESDFGRFFNMPGDGLNYNFELGGVDTPTDLEFDLGASDGKLELDEVDLQNLQVDVGAGKMMIDLEGDAAQVEAVDLNIGAGEVELKLDSEVGFEVDYNVGLGELVVEGEKFGGLAAESIYRSENYEKAKHVVKIKADVGLGKLVIK